MLAALWRDGTTRMTFSSLHAHALPLYARYGLDAWWPLLYLGGDVTALAAPPGWAVAARPRRGRSAGLEREWTGIDRTADHEAWAARPGGQPVLAERDGQPMAVAPWPGRGAEYGIVHLALAPGCGDAEARDAVLAVLARLDPPGGRARVCLPAPHPAARPLLAAGWHNDFLDLYMATEPGLLDPRRAVPSPPPPDRDPAGRRLRRYWRARLAAPPRSTYFWILPVAVLGSSVTKRHPVRRLEVRQPVAGERDDLLLARLRPVAQHHVRVRRLAPLLVRQADDRHLHAPPGGAAGRPRPPPRRCSRRR